MFPRYGYHSHCEIEHSCLSTGAKELMHYMHCDVTNVISSHGVMCTVYKWSWNLPCSWNIMQWNLPLMKETYHLWKKSQDDKVGGHIKAIIWIQHFTFQYT